MIIIFITCIIIMVIAGIVGIKEQEATALALGVIICIMAIFIWAIVTDMRYFNPIKKQDEVIYLDRYGKVDSIYYLVNDTLIEENDIKLR